MSIKAVFRVQCDGPGKEWLRKGRVMPSHWHESYAETFPDEIAARRAASEAGWTERVAGAWLCPKCVLNPLGIVLPKPEPTCPECAHWTRIHNEAGCWAPDCDCERDS